VYFQQGWKKFQEDGNLNYKDCYSFLKYLMTEPLIVDNSKNGENSRKSSAQIYTSSEEEQDVENTSVA